MTMIFDDVHEYIEIIDILEQRTFELTFLLVLLYTMTMIFDHDHELIEIIQFREHGDFEL